MPKKRQETLGKMEKKKTTTDNELDNDTPENVRNKFMTYFLLFFPTVILIAIPGTINGGIMVSMSLKILIAFYQFVTLKTFVDKHYE